MASAAVLVDFVNFDTGHHDRLRRALLAFRLVARSFIRHCGLFSVPGYLTTARKNDCKEVSAQQTGQTPPKV